jgi:hypothetical protein
MYAKIYLIAILILVTLDILSAQEIREYIVKRSTAELNVDGQLIEEEWKAAPLTERFVIYHDGAVTNLKTQAKLLWDDDFLYIGFICEDPDVWATLENRDDFLWNEEVVEILCDPDGDGLNYFEVQVNPLETILDLTLNKAYYAGGQANISWNLDSIQAAVWVDGTLNNINEIDSLWSCEVALPFQELAFLAPSLNFPPQDADEWRILLTRYDYERTGDEVVEISAWNQTDSRGFHVPEKFGRIIFSSENVLSGIAYDIQTKQPVSIAQINSYPNPFNSSTIIKFNVPISSYIAIKIYNITGSEIITLVEDKFNRGNYQAMWDGKDNYGNTVASGIYIVGMQSEYFFKAQKMILSR